MIDALTTNQERNAAGIIAAVRKRNWPVKAAYIAVAAALTESGLRVLASANVPTSTQYPHDLLEWTSDGLGHDHASIGMFQQQTGSDYALPGTSTMGDVLGVGWGSPAELMDPETSTAKFLNALAAHDWQHMDNWVAAQAVQHSAFPHGENYQREDARARRIVDALWSITSEDDEMPMAAMIYQDGRAVRVCDPLMQSSRGFSSATDLKAWKAAFRALGGQVVAVKLSPGQRAAVKRG